MVATSLLPHGGRSSDSMLGVYCYPRREAPCSWASTDTSLVGRARMSLCSSQFGLFWHLKERRGLLTAGQWLKFWLPVRPPLIPPQQGERVALYYFQVGVHAYVPHLVSTDVVDRGRLLTTQPWMKLLSPYSAFSATTLSMVMSEKTLLKPTQGESLSSPLSLCWH